MNIQLDFSLTADEYVNLMRYLVNWRRYAWIVGVAMLVVLAQFFLIGSQALVYLFMLVLFLVLLYFTVQRSIRKGFQISTHLHGPLHYEITDADFRVAMENSNTTYQWTMFQKAREVPEWFLLHQNERLYNFIPKRAFNSPAEVDAFRKFLQTKGLLAA